MSSIADSGELQVEAAIFAALGQELSAVLKDATIAVALPRSGDRCAEGTFMIRHIFSEQLQEFFASTSVSPRLGEILNSQVLQNLESQVPQQAWPILEGPNLLGWVLVLPSQLINGQVAGEAIVAATAQLIERSIQQSVATLRQVKLMQSQGQQYHELKIRYQELEQTNQLKSEFLANTSHEIRTPLSSILGFTHLLREQGYSPINLRHQEYLHIILSSGQHLLSLINDILDLSKIEANQLDLRWEVVDVHSVCQTALTLVREKANDRGLTLRVDIEPQVDSLVADGLRLKQMLFNLLSNALKFTLRGQVGIKVSVAGEFLRFQVWDTGIGISPEQQRLLFRPYAQLANAAAGRDAGTGLGLALTQKLAELHGGWVEVISAVDQGSQFIISLPLVPTALIEEDEEQIIEPLMQAIAARECLQSRQKQQFAEQPLPPQANLQRYTKQLEHDQSNVSRVVRSEVAHFKNSSVVKRSKKLAKGQAVIPVGTIPKQPVPPIIARPNHVLLVEDNAPNAKLMLTYLSKSGYEVTWVRDGQQMWQALERSLPALILMDVNLPDVDGLMLTRQLKADQRFQNIPVVAQTAMAMVGDRDLCLEAGAIDYISKPIDLQALVQLMTRYIQE